MKTPARILSVGLAALALAAALPVPAALQKGGAASAVALHVTEADIRAMANGIIYSSAADAGDYGGEWFYRQSYYKLKRLDIDLLAGDRASVDLELLVQWNTNLAVMQLDLSETGRGKVVLRRPLRVVSENGYPTLNLCTDDIESVTIIQPDYAKWLFNGDETIRRFLTKLGCIKVGSLSNNLPLVPAPLMAGMPIVTTHADRVELQYRVHHYPVNLVPMMNMLLED